MSYFPNKLHKTRFAELRFTMIEPGCWSFVDVSADDPAKVGSHYPTKEQLLSNLERYAAEFGCNGAAPSAKIPDAILIGTLLDALTSALPFVEDAETDPVYKPGWAKKNVQKIRDAIKQGEEFVTGKDVCACGAPIYGRMRVHHCSAGAANV